jgi:O-antigen/teichoic acid export membrane protein
VNLARGHQRFGIVAIGLVARPAVLLLSSVAALRFDYLGLVGSYALSCLVAGSAVFVLMGFPGRAAPRLLLSDLRGFLAVSVPVQIAIAGSWILLTADRLGILFAAGPATLGVWTLATLCSSVVWAIAPAVDQVLFAAFHETLALGKGPPSVAALADRGLLLVSLLVAVSVVVLQIALVPVVDHLLPGFRPGLGAARVYVMGSAFAMMVGIPARALQALGVNRLYTAIVMTGALLILVFTWLTLRIGASLSLVAIVVSSVHVSVLVVVLLVYFRAVGADLRAVFHSSLRWAAAPSVALVVSIVAATLDGS